MVELSARDSAILHSIVQSFINTGEPVGSVALAREHGIRVSAATIRNIMGDLCEQGFLSQPHTSAGRVPTEKAFQSYVKSLAVRVVSAELARMRVELERAQTAEQRVERSSRILSEITHNIGLVAELPGSAVLKSLELVSISPKRVLMVVVTTGNRVSNQVVDVDDPLSPRELESIRNYVNAQFEGWTLTAARRELERRLQLESATYDSVLRRMTELHARGLLDIALDAEVRLGGASNLVGVDLHLTKESLRELFRTLEEKKKLLELLDSFLEGSDEEPSVQVGLSEVNPSLKALSLVGVTVPLPEGSSARLAVLGPVRMDYAKALSAVVHLRRAMKPLSE